MSIRSNLIQKSIEPDASSFDDLALDIFRFQFEGNQVYRSYAKLLGRSPENVKSIRDIPFLPLQFFKSHKIQTGVWEPAAIFESSTTTSGTPGKHLIREIEHYENNAIHGFQEFYGPPQDWCLLALLPSYLERKNSSLVHMCDLFIRRSRFQESGFFLGNFQKLIKVLKKNREKYIPTLLLGVSFALLDLAESYPMDLSGLVVMETGGMKGRREEIPREKLHEILCSAFHLDAIHSEYGMTEMLSQAYSGGNGLFRCSKTMRVLARDINDPLTILENGKTGPLNIIDLANIDSCSFLATDDLGQSANGNEFRVLGRSDHSEWRGCNLLIE